jgi:hypothetical protein
MGRCLFTTTKYGWCFLLYNALLLWMENVAVYGKTIENEPESGD